MKTTTQRLRTIYATQQENDLVYEGLCMNCEHRVTCTFPNARNGVLYCNEYE